MACRVWGLRCLRGSAAVQQSVKRLTSHFPFAPLVRSYSARPDRRRQGQSASGPDLRPRKPDEDLVGRPESTGSSDTVYVPKSSVDKQWEIEKATILRKQKEAGLLPDPLPPGSVGVPSEAPLPVRGRRPERPSPRPARPSKHEPPPFEPPEIVMRVNDTIMAEVVRVIDEHGKQLGVMNYEQAMDVADEHDHDLVEWAPQANPPVCRLMKYKQYLTDQRDKAYQEYLGKLDEMEAELDAEEHEKEMQFNHVISENDLQIKVNKARNWLAKGLRVKVFIKFGRQEDFDDELGREIIQNVYDRMEDLAVSMSAVTVASPNIMVHVLPKAQRQKKTKKRDQYGRRSREAEVVALEDDAVPTPDELAEHFGELDDDEDEEETVEERRKRGGRGSRRSS